MNPGLGGEPRWAVARMSAGERRPPVVCAPLTAQEAQAFLIPGSTARGFYVEPLPPGYRRGDLAAGTYGASHEARSQ